MDKILKELQNVLIDATPEHDFPININIIPKEDTKVLTSVIRFENNSTQTEQSLCRDYKKSNLNFKLFNDINDDSNKAYEILDVVKDTLENYISYYEDYSIIIIKCTDYNGFIGIDTNIQSSVYELKFEVSYHVKR